MQIGYAPSSAHGCLRRAGESEGGDFYLVLRADPFSATQAYHFHASCSIDIDGCVFAGTLRFNERVDCYRLKQMILAGTAA
jgi:hypothetical protein